MAENELNLIELEYYLKRSRNENDSNAKFHIEQIDDMIILEIANEKNTNILFMFHLFILEYVEKRGYTIKDIMGINPCTLLIKKGVKTS